MKSDYLLKQFNAKGLESKKHALQLLANKNTKPIDSGQLIAIKGGLDPNPPVRMSGTN